MMIFSLVVMIGLDKCCITSACLQWLCHSGERIVARGPLVLFLFLFFGGNRTKHFISARPMIYMNCCPTIVFPLKKKKKSNFTCVKHLSKKKKLCFLNSISIK